MRKIILIAAVVGLFVIKAPAQSPSVPNRPQNMPALSGSGPELRALAFPAGLPVFTMNGERPNSADLNDAPSATALVGQVFARTILLCANFKTQTDSKERTQALLDLHAAARLIADRSNDRYAKMMDRLSAFYSLNSSPTGADVLSDFFQDDHRRASSSDVSKIIKARKALALLTNASPDCQKNVSSVQSLTSNALLPNSSSERSKTYIDQELGPWSEYVNGMADVAFISGNSLHLNSYQPVPKPITDTAAVP